jgi:hypothetical protein
MTLFLLGLALLLRGEAALLRRPERSPILQAAGWLVGLAAVWLAVVALGAWAAWWPVLPVALAAVWLANRWRGSVHLWALPLTADALMVLLTGLIAVPPLRWGVLLPTAVFLPLLAFLIDQLAWWATRRIPWGWLAAAGLVPLLLLALIPSAREAAGRMVQGRFVYLLPEETAMPPPPRPEATLLPSPAPSLTPRSTATPPVIVAQTANGPLDAQGTQWSPYIEWRLPNPAYNGNPFDLIASATFTHTVSGETRTTGLFFSGDDTWAFRFSGTQPGEWTFQTQSAEPALDGHTGTVWIEPNPGVAGFVTHYGNKWGREGLDRAFVPQYVMIGNPLTYYDNPAEIAYNIDTFLLGHGFNGVHTAVFCRWFDIEQQQCGRINVADPNPDLRTFEALETLIREVYAAGGVVHIWMWGDDSRSENPKRWGLNGVADQRLQRYIAARLGPLPGWTMGYGYDLWEWVNGEQLSVWHDYMSEQMGWAHYLGARASKNQLDQLTEVLDYASYEQHRPDYELYVQTIEARPDKPAFSEDRFRLREPAWDKDYTMELTRRGLWHSTMAGGVANIWGNLVGAPEANATLTTSAPYPNPEMIQTYARFFAERFWADMVRCNELTDGVCLMRPTQAHYVFYFEDAASINLDLSGMAGAITAVAVDTRLPYQEIELGALPPERQTWNAPYISDWAIAVGDFGPFGEE